MWQSESRILVLAAHQQVAAFFYTGYPVQSNQNPEEQSAMYIDPADVIAALKEMEGHLFPSVEDEDENPHHGYFISENEDGRVIGVDYYKDGRIAEHTSLAEIAFAYALHKNPLPQRN